MTPSGPAPSGRKLPVVMSDNPDAYILERARSWGIPAEVIDCGGFKTKFPEASQARRRRAPEGIRRGLRLPGRIHAPGEASAAEGIPFPHSEHSSFPPSFLPRPSCLGAGREGRCGGKRLHRSLRGWTAWTRAPSWGGARARAAGDTRESLHARIQEQEHALYPAMIARVLETLA